MSLHFAQRRYLINFETQRLGQVFTDVLIIGSGVAGLRAAIEAARYGSVLLVAKDSLTETNTQYAQGGVAVVMDHGDTQASHVADTLEVGCGLGVRPVVETMVRDGPARLRELVDWGAAFDLDKGRVALGLEGGHSVPRIVHAHGDATGREIARALLAHVRTLEAVRVFDNCFVIDLVTLDGAIVGAVTHHQKYGHQIFWAKQTIVATGGAGRLFRETTNSPVATGDGHALAFRAGATLRDMEFIQFHPTTLYIAGATRALVSEAVRGEGGLLVDRLGERFMQRYHEAAELAPRDVVARGIVHRMAETESTHVFLDVRGFKPGRFAERFPTINRLCREFDINPETDLIPVRPAAHYTIGGVAVDASGRSDVPGLLACGESASTGVHGANRLASNSLLEGLVFGQAAGRTAGEAAAAAPEAPRPASLRHAVGPSPRTTLDLPDVLGSLRAVLWRNAGIERTAPRLEETIEIIDFWARYVMDKVFEDRFGWEVQNMLTVARLLAQSALARKESRGVHYRGDYPTMDSERYLGRFRLRRQDGGIHQSFEGLGAA